MVLINVTNCDYLPSHYMRTTCHFIANAFLVQLARITNGSSQYRLQAKSGTERPYERFLILYFAQLLT